MCFLVCVLPMDVALRMPASIKSLCMYVSWTEGVAVQWFEQRVLCKAEEAAPVRTPGIKWRSRLGRAHVDTAIYRTGTKCYLPSGASPA